MGHRVSRLVPKRHSAGNVRYAGAVSGDGGGPDWVRDGLRQFAAEVRLFAETASAAPMVSSAA
jgi:hypothetical protein